MKKFFGKKISLLAGALVISATAVFGISALEKKETQIENISASTVYIDGTKFSSNYISTFTVLDDTATATVGSLENGSRLYSEVDITDTFRDIPARYVGAEYILGENGLHENRTDVYSVTFDADCTALIIGRATDVIPTWVEDLGFSNSGQVILTTKNIMLRVLEKEVIAGTTLTFGPTDSENNYNNMYIVGACSPVTADSSTSPISGVSIKDEAVSGFMGDTKFYYMGEISAINTMPTQDAEIVLTTKENYASHTITYNTIHHKVVVSVTDTSSNVWTYSFCYAFFSERGTSVGSYLKDIVSLSNYENDMTLGYVYEGEKLFTNETSPTFTNIPYQLSSAGFFKMAMEVDNAIYRVTAREDCYLVAMHDSRESYLFGSGENGWIKQDIICIDSNNVIYNIWVKYLFANDTYVFDHHKSAGATTRTIFAAKSIADVDGNIFFKDDFSNISIESGLPVGWVNDGTTAYPSMMDKAIIYYEDKEISNKEAYNPVGENPVYDGYISENDSYIVFDDWGDASNKGSAKNGDKAYINKEFSPQSGFFEISTNIFAYSRNATGGFANKKSDGSTPEMQYFRICLADGLMSGNFVDVGAKKNLAVESYLHTGSGSTSFNIQSRENSGSNGLSNVITGLPYDTWMKLTYIVDTQAKKYSIKVTYNGGSTTSRQISFTSTTATTAGNNISTISSLGIGTGANNSNKIAVSHVEINKNPDDIISDIKIDGTTIANFTQLTDAYFIPLDKDNTIPVVTATLGDRADVGSLTISDVVNSIITVSATRTTGASVQTYEYKIYIYADVTALEELVSSCASLVGTGLGQAFEDAYATAYASLQAKTHNYNTTISTYNDLKMALEAVSTNYSVTIGTNDDTKGTITIVNKDTLLAGDLIPIYLDLEDGYDIETITVTNNTTTETIECEYNAIKGAYEFLMPASDVTISATYKEAEVRITIPTGVSVYGAHGKVIDGALLSKNEELNISYIDNPSRQEILIINGVVYNNNIIYIVGTEDIIIEFSAGDQEYQITQSVSTNGTYTISPSETYYVNLQEITITTSPALGYETLSVIVTDASNNVLNVTNPAINTYKFFMPDSNASISVQFTTTRHAITTNNTTIIGGSWTNMETRAHGAEVITLNYRKNNNQYVLNRAYYVVSGSSTEVEINTTTGSFTMPASDITIYAELGYRRTTLIIPSGVSVSRISSNITGATTGALVNGDVVYASDVLTITASAPTGYYETIALTVNGATLADGSYTITNDDFSIIYGIALLELTSIELTTPPADIIYSAFETLDLTGAVITATFNNGATVDVTNDVVITYVNGGDSFVVGETYATATYNYSTGTNRSVQINVDSVAKLIPIIVNPTASPIYYGQSVLESTLSNGSVSGGATFVWESNDGECSPTVVASGTAYTVIVTVTDSDNYDFTAQTNWNAVAKTFEIEIPVTVRQRIIDLSTISVTGSKMIDPTPGTPVIFATTDVVLTGSLFAKVESVSETDTDGNSLVSAGYYNVNTTVQTSDSVNYIFSDGTNTATIVARLQVLPNPVKPSDVEVISATKGYNHGNAITLTAGDFTEVLPCVSITTIETFNQTSVGTYVDGVVITLTTATNYLFDTNDDGVGDSQTYTMSVDVEITPYTILTSEISVSGTKSWTGNPISFIADDFVITGTEYATITSVEENANTAVGNYNITATLTANTNYEFEGDSVTYNVTATGIIAPITLTVIGEDIEFIGTKTYNGSAQEYTADDFTIPAHTSMSISTITGQNYINAGSPTIKITLTADTGYVINGNASEEFIITTTISREDITISNTDITQITTKIYNGEDQSFVVGDFAMLKSNVSISAVAKIAEENYRSAGNPTIRLTIIPATANYSVNGSTSTDIVVTTRIQKANSSITTLPSITNTLYIGQKISDISLSEDWVAEPTNGTISIKESGTTLLQATNQITIVYTPNDVVNYNISERNMTATAEYLSVIFHSNFGEDTTTTQSISYDTSTILNNNTFIRTGYIFAGWSITVDGTIVDYANASRIKTTQPTTNLYAIWIGEKTEITLYSNNDSGMSVTADISYGDSIIIGFHTITRTGYNLLGYYTLTTDGIKVINADGSLVPSVEGYTNASSEWILDERSVDLYAQWEGISIDINYNNLKGMENVNPTTHIYGTMTSLTPLPNPTGYTFAGWAFSNAGATITSIPATYTTTSPLNIFAKWTTNNENLTFTANYTGNIEGDTIQVIKYNETANLNVNPFTRTGYTFAGWNTVNDGSGDSYADGASYTMRTEGSKLFAQWTPEQYIITYENLYGIANSNSDRHTYNTATPLVALTNKVGLSFQGWSLTEDGALITEIGATSITENTTVYAVWTKYFANSGEEGVDGTSWEKAFTIATAQQLRNLSLLVNGTTTTSIYKGLYYKLIDNISLNDETFTFEEDSGLVRISNADNFVYIGTGIKGTTSFTATASESGKWYNQDKTKMSIQPSYSNESYTINGMDIDVWNAIGNMDISYNFTVFNGHFDGNGNTISGVFTTNSPFMYEALFGMTQNAEIKNIGMINGYIMNAEEAAGIAAYSTSATITNCYNEMTIATTDSNSAGIAGTAYATTIENCYNAGTVWGAGISYDFTYGSIMKNCYNIGKCGKLAITRDITNATLLNNYWLEGSAPEVITTGTVRNGEINSFDLNGIITASANITITKESAMDSDYVVSNGDVLLSALRGYITTRTTPTNYSNWIATPSVNNGYPYFGTSYTTIHNLTNITASPEASYGAVPGYDYVVTLTANDNYSLPTEITITIGGEAYINFTYITGVITIPAIDVTGEIVITASGVANPYDVVFNNNNGSGNMENLSMLFGSSANLTLNTFTKAGYDFAGWNTVADGTGTLYTDGAEYTMTTDGATLYAQWTEKRYTLTYNYNDGTGTPISKDVAYNTAIGTLPTPTRNGYDFAGWKIGETSITDATIWTYTLGQTADAQWTPKTYNLTYSNLNGATNSNSETHTYGTTTILVNAGTRTGYSFEGWALTVDGATITEIGATAITENTTIYAKWTANTYFIIFDKVAESAEGTMRTQPVVFGELVNLNANTFTRLGHVFGSWRTEDYLTEYEDGAFFTMTTEGITLYASWIRQNYNITFDANFEGNTQIDTTQSVTFGIVETLNANTFTREGFVFDGWNTMADGSGDSYSDGADYIMNAEGATLYAQWVNDRIAISINTTPQSPDTYSKSGTAYRITGTDSALEGFVIEYLEGAVWTTNQPILVGKYNVRITRPEDATHEAYASGIIVDGVEIVAKELSISGVIATNREYDESTSVSLTGGELVGVVLGDDVTLVTEHASGSMIDANAGQNKIVTTTGYAISGSDVTNYRLTQPTSVVTISQATNSWAVEPSIMGWYVGQNSNTPTYQSVFGNAEAVVEYIERNVPGAEYGAKPSVAGTYSMRVRIPGNENYTELSKSVDFDITQLTVTFNDYDGTLIDVVEVSYDGTATHDNPTRTGTGYVYTFDKWVTTIDGIEEADLANIKENRIVYAAYTRQTNSYMLTINYYYTGTTETIAPAHTGEVVYGETYSVNSPNISGYTPDTLTVDGNMDTEGKIINVYYTANTYTVKYFLDGIEQTDLQQIGTFDTQGTYPILPTKVGYSVSGWYAETPQGEQTPIGVTTYLNLTNVNGAEVNRYAFSTANTYTLTYDYNEGAGVPESIEVRYGEAIGTLSSPTRTGHVLSGWKIGEESVDNTTVWNYIEDKTIVAQWSVGTYNLTLHYIDPFGQRFTDTQEYLFGETKQIKQNVFNSASIDNNTFHHMGWTTKQNELGGTSLSYLASDIDYELKDSFTMATEGADLYSVYAWTIYFVAERDALSVADGYKYDAVNGFYNKYIYDNEIEAGYTLPTITKTGHTFVGWFCYAIIDETGIPRFYNNEFQYSTENNSLANETLFTSDKAFTEINMYDFNPSAFLCAKVTVNSYSMNLYDNYATPEQVGEGIVNYGDEIALPGDTYTRYGYEFTGWNTERDGSGTAYSAGDIYIVSTSDVNLYAQWSVGTYNLTLAVRDVVSGNIQTITSQSYTFGETKTIPANVMDTYFANYGLGVHMGWATTPNFPQYYTGDAIAYLPTANFTMTTEGATLYAVAGIPLQFVTSGYALGEEYTQVTANEFYVQNRTWADIATGVTLPTVVANAGFTTVGWFGYGAILASGGDNNPYFVNNALQYNAQLTAAIFNADTDFENINNTNYNPSYFTMFVLKVTVNEYTLTVYDNHSTPEKVGVDSVQYGDQVTLDLPEQFTRTGYIFAGWNTERDGTGTSYALGAAYTMGIGDVNLYAQWTVGSFDVKFIPGTDSTSPECTAQEFIFGETKVLLLNTFTKTDYKFKGWSTTSGGEVEYANGANYTMLTEGAQLWAVWELDQFLVSFYNFEGAGNVLLKQEYVLNGESATEPETPTRSLYKWAGWSASSSNITEDTIIYGTWIRKLSHSPSDFTPQTYTYTGAPIPYIIDVEFTDGEWELKYSHYPDGQTSHLANNIIPPTDVGEYAIKVGHPQTENYVNFSASLPSRLIIQPKDLTIRAEDISQAIVKTYNGDAISFTASDFTVDNENVQVTGVTIIEGQDYTNYGNPTIKVTVEPINGNYTINGNATAEITITTSISKATPTITLPSYNEVFIGQKIKDIVLVDGVGPVESGTFSIKEDGEIVLTSTQSLTIIYNPNNNNYNLLEERFVVNATQLAVTFNDYDGRLIEVVDVSYGETVTHANPTRTGVGYVYAFDKWVTTQGGTETAVLTNITANKTVYARYIAQANAYTLTINYYKDGTTNTIATQYTSEVDYDATYSVTSPTITGYTADSLIVSGTMDAEGKTIDVYYTANAYTLTINYYKDGTTNAIATQHTSEVDYDATYSVTSPTITGYTADSLIVSGTMDAEGKTIDVYYTINTYTIIWKNWDDSILEMDENVEYGTSPSYNRENPTKENTETYKYEFIGWTPRVEDVIEDAEYIATYEQKLIKIESEIDPEDDTQIEGEVEIPEGVEDESTLIVKIIEDVEIDENIVAPKGQEILETYNAKLYNKDGIAYDEYPGTFTIKIKAPEGIESQDNIKVVIIEDNEVKVKDAILTDDGYISFETNNLGDFAIVVGSGSDSVGFNSVLISLGCLLILTMGASVLLIAKKKKANKEEEK